MVGRDNWQRDESLNYSLLERLRKNNIEIIWEDPVVEFIYLYRKMEQKFIPIFKSAPQFNSRVIKILYGLIHPSYFYYLYKMRKVGDSIRLRCESLKKMIQKRGIADRTIILSRSSGGRVSSLIADELSLKYIICLSYPFKHPEMSEEPERYEHLSTIKTPMLIFQGVRDVYGGLDIKEKYTFSTNVKLHFMDTNHDFDINQNQFNELFESIENIIDL